MSSSLFDSRDFNERLFFPRADAGPAPREAEDSFIAVEGATLHLRWHRRFADAPTVLLFHGNGEVVSDYDVFAPQFAIRGANLMVVDYRGYGRSSGRPTLRNAIEDAPRVVAAVAPLARRLVVMGRSLGSACAAEVYQAPREAVVGFIWESGAVDLHGLVRRRGIAPPAQFSDADLETFDVRRKLGRGRHPLLVLHGEADALIPVEEAQLAFAAAGTSEKTLCLIPAHGHNDLMHAQLYGEAMATFIGALHR
jgi:alpha-beta hydrolase superfamily lysophospholipase